VADGILNQIACPGAKLDPLGAELDRIKGEAFTPVAERLFMLALAVHAMHYPLPLCGPAAEEDNLGACPHNPELDWDEHFEADDGSWCCTRRVRRNSPVQVRGTLLLAGAGTYPRFPRSLPHDR